MNGNSVLLDTNIVLYLLGGDKVLAELLNQKKLYLSFISQLELLGFRGITQKQQTQQIQIDTMDHSAPSFPNQTQSQTNLHSTNAENNKVKQRLMYDI